MGILVVGLELKATKGVYLYSLVHTGYLVADKSSGYLLLKMTLEGSLWCCERLSTRVGYPYFITELFR